MIRPPSEIRTRRLRLRFPVLSDAGAVFEGYATDAEVTRYVMWTPHQSLESVADFIQERIRRIDTGEEFTWAITLTDDDAAIGMIGARVREHKVDIGYVLARKHWNQGYMTEAISSIAGWLLGQSSVFRVWAVCDIENTGSARVLEKSGFVREGVLRNWVVHPNRSSDPRDCFVYSRTQRDLPFRNPALRY